MSGNVDFVKDTPTLIEQMETAGGVLSLNIQEILLLGSISILLLAILRYYLAKIFSDEQGVVKAKADILDTIIIAVMVLALTIAFNVIEYFSSQAFPAYFEEGTVNFIEGYLRPTIYNTMIAAARLGQKHAVSASSYFKEGGVSFSIFTYSLLGDPSYANIKKGNEYILKSQLETSLAIGLSIAYSALGYIKDSMGYFLLIGLGLRLIPFLRGAGAFLIALSIGFYYIYPLSTAMFLFGIPKISLEESKEVFKDISQAFCKMKATGAFVLPKQDLSKSLFSISFGSTESLEEDFGLIVSTEFLLSQLVSLSLTAMFINNLTLVLSRGIYTGADITTVLNRLL